MIIINSVCNTVSLTASICLSSIVLPHCTGVPAGCKPISAEEKKEILSRWEGKWEIQPLPPMAVKGYNKKFYIQYTTAHLDEENVYLSGGTHIETQVSKTKGSVSTGVFTSAQVHGTTKTQVEVGNEGQSNKIIFLRAPDGRLFIDNIGSYLVSEEPTKLKFQTAAGWPMTLRRDVILTQEAPKQ